MKCDDKSDSQRRKQNILRIAHFVSSLSVNSGVMAVIMNYYRHIDRNKIQFDFLYFKDLPANTTYIDEIEHLGGRIYLIEQPTHVFHYMRKLDKFLKEHKGEYVILHIHEVYLTFLLAPIAHVHGLKVITHCHSTKFSDKPLNAIRNRLACIGINNHADLRLACSKAAGIALYGRNTDFAVINNAIDLEKFAFKPAKRVKLRNELGVGDKVVIGHVGRFNKEKNHKFLIEIFYETQKTLPNSTLLLIGEGPLMKSVKEHVRSLGLEDKVIFLGRRTDVADLYNVMDVFLFPSLFEGLGIVLIEAQANGLPCVASSCVPDEADVGGITFVSLKQSVEEWHRNLMESLLLSRDKNSSPHDITMQKYNIKVMVRMLEREYFKLIS